MTPTREQFKEFIAAVQKAQQKEDNLNKALELIWDDDQGQYPPILHFTTLGCYLQSLQLHVWI